MAEIQTGDTQVDARVVYWGVEGSGKTTNLNAVFSKLRPDHRSDLREVPTRFDPTVCYEVLPIELGEISGVRTRIQIVAVPGAPEQGPTRKQLLDRVDGIVMVIDSRSERIDDNLASFDELRTGLAAYGRSLDEVPLVVQYNKRDLADPYVVEELHRKLDLGATTVFEAVATEGSGVLQTLSTISKRVIRTLRERPGDDEDLAPAPKPETPPPVETPVPQAPIAEPETLSAEPETFPAESDEFPAELDMSSAEPDEFSAELEASPAERMEQAILGEGEHPDAEAIEATTRATEDLLEAPAWPEIAGEIERPRGARIGPGLTIVSVGEATRVGERRVRIPLVLGDPDGETATMALTIELDPLVDEHR
jgi:signal recognition particle receptor subunit beta